MLAGADEAGKGSVIGPMVVGGVICSQEAYEDLLSLGLKDSKKLTPKKRERLFTRINEFAKTATLSISAGIIDMKRNSTTINDIILECIHNLLKNFQCSIVYVDSPDVNCQRFGMKLSEKLNTDVVSLHRADEKIPIVMAASIVAKVKRDREIQILKEKEGVDFGSGYPSDPKTKEFLLEWYRKHKNFPPYVRHSWKTLDKIKSSAFNSTLF